MATAVPHVYTIAEQDGVHLSLLTRSALRLRCLVLLAILKTEGLVQVRVETLQTRSLILNAAI